MYKRIGLLRKSNGKTQKEVAEILGVSQGTYARYERGESPFPATCLLKLSLLYDVSSDYIVEQTDNPKKRH